MMQLMQLSNQLSTLTLAIGPIPALGFAMLPVVSVGAAGVLVWLLVSKLTKDDRKAQG